MFFPPNLATNIEMYGSLYRLYIVKVLLFICFNFLNLIIDLLENFLELDSILNVS
jgi:hypothetical protein